MSEMEPPVGSRVFTPDEATRLLREALDEFVGQKATPEVLAAIKRKLAAVMEEHDGMWVDYSDYEPKAD
jgi:hypothetical protein